MSIEIQEAGDSEQDVIYSAHVEENCHHDAYIDERPVDEIWYQKPTFGWGVGCRGA
jgi:hypothetical protein